MSTTTNNAVPPTSIAITTTSSKKRIAVAQLCSTSNKVHNMANVAACAAAAHRAGCCMLFLPENFGFMGESRQETTDNAEPPLVVGQKFKERQHAEKNDPSMIAYLRDIIHQPVHDGSSSEACTGLPPPAALASNDKQVDLLDALQAIASASQLWISAGGMHIRCAATPPVKKNTGDDDHSIDQQLHHRVYNTHLILDNLGTVRAVYRKIHLFDVNIPGQIRLCESDNTVAGTELVVCDSPIGRLGLSTCYDVRFPELYTTLVQDGGAEVLLVPSAFTVPTGQSHWHILLQARAIEQQCFVIAAAQYGRHNTKRVSYGHALVVDPWGTILADAGGYDHIGLDQKKRIETMLPTVDSNNPSSPVAAATMTTTTTTALAITPRTPSIVMCEIDRELLESIRQRIPIATHRRNAKYSFAPTISGHSS